VSRAALASLLVLALAGCGHAARTTTSTSPRQPAGGPVPKNFDPVSFTAISSREFWVLGDATCARSVCTSIVRTTDGGKTFVGLPAPPVPLTNSNDRAGSIDTLHFATPLVGYAFDEQGFPAAGATKTPIWQTTDGGAHWRRLPTRNVRAFATGGGYVYLVVAGCGAGVCSHLTLQRAPLGSTRRQATPLHAPGVEAPLELAVHGKSVWLSVSPAAGDHPNQILFSSSDAGSTFTTGTSPCTNGLGGEIEPSSASVLWAVCPTGMLSGAVRSSDGGAHWQPLDVGRELVNSARIAPAGDATAVVATGDQAQLLRTTDGGRTFREVYPRRAGSWSFVGFTDATTGVGIRTLPGRSRTSLGPPLAELMQTTDGGATWTVLPVR
jgi:photosystem II stability/assembly factor-like uncharacterized protein